MEGLLKKLGKKMRSVINLDGRRYGDDDPLSDVERLRQRRYLIRSHYADPGANDDGTSNCPLYYASIEGLGGEETQNLASLKELPKKNPPPDYRMVSLANWVPQAIEADVGCMLNGFAWDQMKLTEDGKTNTELTEQCIAFWEEAREKCNLTLGSFIRHAGSRGDGYLRAKLDKEFDTGVRFDVVPAEACFPQFDPWDERCPEAYRIVFETLPTEVGDDPTEEPESGGDWQTHVEYIDKKGVKVYRNGEPVSERTKSHGGQLDEIPLVHIAYRETEQFFGAPAVDGEVVAAIDDLNVVWSHINNVSMQTFGVPVLFLYGVSKQETFPWGSRIVKGLPKDSKAELLAFKDFDKLVNIAQEKDKLLRMRIPQLALLELRSASSVNSGISLLMKLYLYDSYLASLEQQFTKAIGHVNRIALKLIGKWPKKSKLMTEVAWGPRFPQDVQEQIKDLESRIKTFGKIKPVMERAAREAGYSAREVAIIVKNAERDNEADMRQKETNAAGGGPVGASMARQDRASSGAAKPAAKPAQPTLPATPAPAAAPAPAGPPAAPAAPAPPPAVPPQL